MAAHNDHRTAAADDTWTLTRTHRTEAGDTVRWDRLGPERGEAVVLLHGTPFSSRVWSRVARALAQRRCVYVFDMPGYGTSGAHPGQDVSLAAQGRTFAGLLRSWGLDSARHAPSVVAHDIGGAVALRAHLLHGARYRRLALVDPVALAPWGSPFFRLVGQHAPVFEQLPPALHAALVRAYLETTGGPGLPERVLDRHTAPWLGPTGQAAFYRQIAQADEKHTDEIEPLYGRISLPVSVLWGSGDRWIPAEAGRSLARRIPGATFRTIDGAGHLVPEDAPAELTDALRDFLAGTEPVASAGGPAGPGDRGPAAEPAPAG